MWAVHTKWLRDAIAQPRPSSVTTGPPYCAPTCCRQNVVAAADVICGSNWTLAVEVVVCGVDFVVLETGRDARGVVARAVVVVGG